jgi:hypothetical protein
VRRAGLGLQAGVAVNLSDSAVHVLDQIEGTSSRTQTFVTLGMFQDASRLAWAASYDLLNERYYDSFVLGQLRGQIVYHLTSNDDAGVWFAKESSERTDTWGTRPFASIRFRRSTPSWRTAGRWAPDHRVGRCRQPSLGYRRGAPGQPARRHGGRVWRPAGITAHERVSITGSGNFLTPATGTVEAYLGVTIHPGRVHSSRSRFAAPMMFANNPEFRSTSNASGRRDCGDGVARRSAAPPAICRCRDCRRLPSCLNLGAPAGLNPAKTRPDAGPAPVSAAATRLTSCRTRHYGSVFTA